MNLKLPTITLQLSTKKVESKSIHIDSDRKFTVVMDEWDLPWPDDRAYTKETIRKLTFNKKFKDFYEQH